MNHPKDYVGCPECDADADTWEKKRRLPQIEQTYECRECGHEVYAYDVSDLNEGPMLRWRTVTDSMAMNLRFFGEVRDWPDSALEDLYKQGLERTEAIDYRIVEGEGLSQTEWAEKTERKQPTVSESVSKALAKLDESNYKQPNTPSNTMNIKPFSERDINEVAEKHSLDADELMKVVEFAKSEIHEYDAEFAESVFEKGHGEHSEPTTLWENDEYLIAYCDPSVWDATIDHAATELDIDPEMGRAMVWVINNFARRNDASEQVLGAVDTVLLPKTETVLKIKNERR